MKDRKLSIRISDEDLQTLHRKADKAKLSITDYVTKCILEKQIFVIDGLLLDSTVITWDYCYNSSPELLGKMSVKQNNLTDEVVALIKEILSEKELVSFSEIEEEVYIYTLDLITKMIQTSTQMLSNYNGYKEYKISTLQSLEQYLADYRRSHMNMDLTASIRHTNEMCNKTFTAILSRDQIYRNIYGLQVLYASMIKEALDSEVINKDKNYKDLAETIAFSFKGYFNAYIKRYTDLGFYPNTDEICSSIWDIYCKLVDGLDYATINNLDKSLWKPIEDGESENKDKLINRLKRQREVFLSNLKDKENEKFFENNPKIKKEVDELNNELKILKEEYEVLKENSRVKAKDKSKYLDEVGKIKYELILC